MDTVWRSEDLGPDEARWVMTSAGRQVLTEVMARDELTEDPLRTAAHLRNLGLTSAQAATAHSVAVASRAARGAGHPAGSWWTPAAREQASHPQVAAWRARRYRDQHVVDVTAGCGGDALALEELAATLVAIERSAARVPLLRANLADSTPVVQADAGRPPVHAGRWTAWADPSRRSGGTRRRGLGQLQPSVPALSAVGFAGLGIAVSPAVDLDDPARPADAEWEFVQVGRQLTEATLWLGALRERGPGPVAAASATLLPGGHHLRGVPTGPAGPVTAVGEWLCVPAPALVRARLADGLAGSLGLTRIAACRALYTGAHDPASPWLDAEPVEAVVPARPHAVADVLAALDQRPLTLVTHGMQLDLPTWWRRLGRPPRGPAGRAVHLARLDDRAVAIVTRR